MNRKKLAVFWLGFLLLLALCIAVLSERSVELTDRDLRSPGCSALYIGVSEGEYKWLTADQENTSKVSVRYVSESGDKDETFHNVTIHGHGNSTWNAEKKSWTLNFNTAAGLLDTEVAEKYILTSMIDDKSYIRNKITFDLARESNPEWSQDCELTELFIGGEYMGLYLLTEKIDCSNGTLCPKGSEGAFLVEVEREDATGTGADPYYAVRYAKGIDDAAVREKMRTVNRALRSEDGIDPISGKAWDELIDIDSFVRLYILNEFSANEDTNCSSAYYYCKGGADGKIYAGPVWDFDKAYGARKESPDEFFALQRYFNTYTAEPWYKILYDTPAFYDRVCELYETEYLPRMEEMRDGSVQAEYLKILEAAERDRAKWKDESDRFTAQRNINGPNNTGEALQEWIGARIEFLNRCWIDGEDLYEDGYMVQYGGRNYRSIADLGFWDWLAWHKTTLGALCAGAAIGGAFLVLLWKDYKRSVRFRRRQHG